MPHVLWSETRSWVGSGEGRHNEDYALVCPDLSCAVLVDGATGLTKANLVEGTSDAAWYARELAHGVVRHLRDQASRDVRAALALAGKDVAQKYLSLPGASELSRIDLPNASVALLGWDEQALSVCMLGDCTAVVGTDEGCVVVHDAALDALDSANYEHMYEYAIENHTSMAAARVALNHLFKQNRLRMNEPGGYWAADITCRGFGHELVRRFPLGNVRFAFACSDGFAQATDMGVAQGVAALAQRVARKEGVACAQALRRAEQEDKGCWRVHRSKTSDDATYAVLTFE